MYFLPPFAKDPRFDPEPGGVPAGIGAIGQEAARISIEGGPVPVTISIAGDWTNAAIAALRSHDAGALSKIDSEFTPFWCFRCENSYCKEHWRTGTRFEEGFFDCIQGICPQGHRQTLMD